MEFFFKFDYNLAPMSSQNYKLFWEEALKQIKQEYIQKNQADEFQIWFNMTYVEDNANEIKVAVPSEFLWDKMMELGYVLAIQNKLMEITGQTLKIICEIRKKTESLSVPIVESVPVDNQNSVTQNSSNSSENSDNSERVQIINEEKPKTLKKHPDLNLDYTFEKFVPSDSNILAYNASLAAAKNPGKAYNPILIYGGVGLGKTHLMQSIGNYIYNENPEKLKICYITTEDFTNEFLVAIKNQTTQKFKEKYRSLDVLLLDDIHFIMKKDRTQEELFYTFEALYQKKAQIVFTCDRPISELTNIEERLKSRFGRGMTIDLKLPDFESRCAIIQKKLEIMGKTMPEDFINYIAKNVQTNIRDIESSVTKIIGFTDLVQRPINLEVVQNLLRDNIEQQTPGTINIETIQKTVADYYGVSLSDIKSKRKNKKFVVPRQIAIYISRILGQYSYPQLGDEFGGRDHTTIIHSFEMIEKELKTGTNSAALDSTIQTLIRKIKENSNH